MFQCGRFRSLRMVCSVTAKVSQLYYNTLLGFFLTRLSSMKCTESEDEEPIKGKESQLQLSCFINQEVKYLATGLRLVCIRLLKKKAEYSLKCVEMEECLFSTQKLFLARLSLDLTYSSRFSQSGSWLVCLRGIEDQILFLPVLSPETAGRNHKNVNILGKKCPLYKICKFFLCLKFVIFFFCLLLYI